MWICSCTDDDEIDANEARLGAAWVIQCIHPSFRARMRWQLYFFLFTDLRALELANPRTWTVTLFGLVHQCARPGHTGHLKVPSLWWETRRAGPLGNGTF